MNSVSFTATPIANGYALIRKDGVTFVLIIDAETFTLFPGRPGQPRPPFAIASFDCRLTNVIHAVNDWVVAYPNQPANVLPSEPAKQLQDPPS